MSDTQNEKQTPIVLLPIIQEFRDKKLDTNSFVELLMEMPDDKVNLYIRAWEWTKTFDEYRNEYRSKDDLQMVIPETEDIPYQLWQSQNCPNGFTIVDTNTGYCYSGYGYRVVGYYISLVDGDKYDVWQKIFDAKYKRGNEGYKRYDSFIDTKKMFSRTSEIKKIFDELSVGKSPMKGITGLDPHYINFILLDHEGQYWFTMSRPDPFEPLLYTRIEFE